MNNIFKNLSHDLRAGLVVFLVALPLCLGIGHASTDLENITGMPNAFTGIIAGIIGGIVVGLASGSRLGVSGPAAGLVLIILDSIQKLGHYEAFLLAIVIAGLIQLLAGFLKAGIIVNYFPSSVIKGMLAAIGITLILKEIPHFIGYDRDYFGDEAFIQQDGHNTISEIMYAAGSLNMGSIIIGFVSLGLILFMEQKFVKKLKVMQFIPGALLAVIIGVALNEWFKLAWPQLAITSKHLVSLPVANHISDYGNYLFFPDWNYFGNSQIYLTAITIALVASLESLLSLEATNKLDPEKHIGPANRELKAQGLGNIVSGLIGGLPITQVIVRSSANITAGGKSKLSAVFHGILLLICVLFIPEWINKIPLSTLAAILLMVGYKLTRVQLFRDMFSLGYEQFIPFIGTIIAIQFTDLLRGIGIGVIIALAFILKRNYDNNYKKIKDQEGNCEHTILKLTNEVTFLNKGSIIETMMAAPKSSILTIDGSACEYIDYDVLEFIHDFEKHQAPQKNIDLRLIHIPQIQFTSSH